jgi:hypothetical protein
VYFATGRHRSVHTRYVLVDDAEAA